MILPGRAATFLPWPAPPNLGLETIILRLGKIQNGNSARIEPLLVDVPDFRSNSASLRSVPGGDPASRRRYWIPRVLLTAHHSFNPVLYFPACMILPDEPIILPLFAFPLLFFREIGFEPANDTRPRGPATRFLLTLPSAYLRIQLCGGRQDFCVPRRIPSALWQESQISLDRGIGPLSPIPRIPLISGKAATNTPFRDRKKTSCLQEAVPFWTCFSATSS